MSFFPFGAKHFRAIDDSTSNYVDVSAPTGLSASYSLILPPAQGGANTVLTDDGSGNLSWAMASSVAITSLTGDVTGIGPGATATTISVGAVTDTKASLANKPSATVVATTNQTLSGTPTIDGVATVAGSIALLTAQSTGSQNGPWVVASGAWSRPTWYPSGGTTQAFQTVTILIRLGTTYQGSVWRITTSGSITIDTTSTAWAVTPVALDSSTVTGFLPVVNIAAGSNGQVLSTVAGSTAWASPAFTGTVTSVAFSDTSTTPIYAITGSPVTSSGTLTQTLSNQNANLIFSGPSSGAATQPSFRTLVGADINPALALIYFGDGSDGNVTISGSVTLTRDMYYNNLTISAGAVLITASFRIFVAGTLDITAAPAGSIIRNGSNGSTATTGTGGGAGSGNSLGSLASSGSGGGGGAGNTGAGSGGTQPANYTGNGGQGTGGANGGSGSSGSGGSGGTAGTQTTLPIHRWAVEFLRATTAIGGGSGGGGGGGGGGNGTSTGGGGGGGAAGAAFIFISANVINRGGSTAANTVQVNGGTGGGGAVGQGATACGGGGGGAGGAGGWIYLAYGSLSGSTATNVLSASGGAGGNGGNGTTTGNGGTGGSSGYGGRITLLNLGTQAISESTGSSGTAGGAASGTTGGIGASANTFQVSL